MRFFHAALIGFFCHTLLFPFAGNAAYVSPESFVRQRQASVDRYRTQSKYKESVLEAILKVPREYFMPENIRHLAYNEQSVPIGYGQTITNLWFMAYMTDLLQLKATDSVLEIGSGSGCQGAILYQITRKVFTIEIVPQLAELARQRWNELGMKGIQSKAGDGYYGWEEKGPFDKIIVTCAADHVPVFLLRQLKPGGIMLIPVGNPFARQTLLQVTKDAEGKVTTQRLRSVKFVPFTGKMLEKNK